MNSSLSEIPAAASPSFIPLPERKLRYHVSLPFPAEFDFDPLVKNATLTACARHRLYYPLGNVLCLSIGTAGFCRFWIPPSVACILLGTLSICLQAWLVVTLTRVDRRIASRLLRSFEWWWLMGNASTAVIMWLLSRTTVVESITVSFLPAVFLYAFCLDAVVSSSRFGRGGVLSVILFICVWNVVKYHIRSYAEQIHTRDLFFGSSSLSLMTACLTTLAIFMAKYLVLLIFTPDRLLIISTRIRAKPGGHAADEEEEDAQQQQAMQTMPSRAQLQQSLLSSDEQV